MKNCNTCKGLQEIFDQNSPCHSAGTCDHLQPKDVCKFEEISTTCGEYGQMLYENIIPDNSRKRQQNICKYLLKYVNLTKRAIVFYSNPVLPPQLNLRNLTNLTHEMKNVLNMISPIDIHVEPASSVDDLKLRIQQFRPEVIFWSGHAFADSLLFELPNGKPDLPINSILNNIFNEEFINTIVLLSCSSKKVVSNMSFTKSKTLVGFETIVEDSAAATFAKGMLENLKEQLNETMKISGQKLYDSGLNSFTENGYKPGDPKPYIHPPLHPHLLSPVLGCEHCFPPVHGLPFIMKT